MSEITFWFWATWFLYFTGALMMHDMLLQSAKYSADLCTFFSLPGQVLAIIFALLWPFIFVFFWVSALFRNITRQK